MLKQKVRKKVVKLAYQLLAGLSAEERNQKQYHFAFLIHKGNICFFSSNLVKTHPAILKFNYKPGADTLHAELATILKAGQTDLSNYDMVVLRIAKRDGQLAFSKPCSGCDHCIRQTGIKRCYYSLDNGNFELLI